MRTFVGVILTVFLLLALWIGQQSALFHRTVPRAAASLHKVLPADDGSVPGFSDALIRDGASIDYSSPIVSGGSVDSGRLPWDEWVLFGAGLGVLIGFGFWLRISLVSEQECAPVPSVEPAAVPCEVCEVNGRSNFRAVFHGSTSGMAIVNLDGRTLEQNETTSKLIEGSFDVGQLGHDAGELAELFLGTRERLFSEIHCGSNPSEQRWVGVDLSVVRDEEAAPSALLAVLHDVTEKHRMEERLHFEARHDILTGLPNRVEFFRLLERRLARVGALSSAILVFEINQFNLVHESAGKAVGDQVIARTAQRLRSALRRGDIVGRLGDNEFGIISRNVGDRAALEERARDALASIAQPIYVNDREHMISATVGIVTLGNEYGNVEEVLRAVDAAMYHARSSGERIVFYDDSMRAHVGRKAEIIPALRNAIVQKEFSMAFQPIVDLDAARIVSFEALLRWQHPRLGSIPPGEFIPLAEELGLMVPLGRLAVEQALSAISTWRREVAAWEHLRVNVNISARELVAPDYIEFLMNATREHHLKPSEVLLEVTECALQDRGEGVLHTCDRLKLLGFNLGIDDFGTGYSSLAYLQRFPFDELKIDRSFVSGAEGKVASPPIVSAVLSLGRSFGVRVVAEGVETTEQARELAAMGCAYAQGYWFGVPHTDTEVRNAYGRLWSLASDPLRHAI
jgi:diguanylate cyclase (GGDEF)-like protein